MGSPRKKKSQPRAAVKAPPGVRGRKKLPDLHRRGLAKRLKKSCEEFFGNALKEPKAIEKAWGVFGKTVCTWLAPPKGETWVLVKTPDLPSLFEFCERTGRSIGWLLTDEGPEMKGEHVKKGTLSRAFAAHVVAAVRRERGFGVVDDDTIDIVNRSAALDHATDLLVKEWKEIKRTAFPHQVVSQRVGELVAALELAGSGEAHEYDAEVRKRLSALYHPPTTPLQWVSRSTVVPANSVAFRKTLERNGYAPDTPAGVVALQLALTGTVATRQRGGARSATPRGQ